MLQKCKLYRKILAKIELSFLEKKYYTVKIEKGEYNGNEKENDSEPENHMLFPFITDPSGISVWRFRQSSEDRGRSWRCDFH